jgi:hypothetical protein
MSGLSRSSDVAEVPCLLLSRMVRTSVALMQQCRPSQATRYRKTKYGSRSTTAGDHARQPSPATPQVSVMDDQFGTHRMASGGFANGC